jgi:NADPH:quinone reductase-like Zn-dependent oxidoreductase
MNKQIIIMNCHPITNASCVTLRVSSICINRVFGQLETKDKADGGRLQQFAILDAEFAAPLPKNVSADQALTLPINGIAAVFTLFDNPGFGFPAPFPGFPGEAAGKAFDYSHKTLVIIGGGVNSGKLGIQFARLAGFGRIIAIASVKNETEMKSYGATDVIDRHAGDDEIRRRVRVLSLADEVNYVYDVVSWKHNLAVSLLSDTKIGMVVTLHQVEIDESELSRKEYKAIWILGISHARPELGKLFWKALLGWFEEVEITPLDFKVG